MSPAGLVSVAGAADEPTLVVPADPDIPEDTEACVVVTIAGVVPATGDAVPPLLQAARTPTPASSAMPVRMMRDRTAIVGSLPWVMSSATSVKNPPDHRR
jgi:hypothetical protein